MRTRWYFKITWLLSVKLSPNNTFYFFLQKAVQEKFRQAGENLEALNDWLNKVEKEIARQEVLSEDVESLKTQISAMKLIKTDVDDHNRPVNNTLDIIAELVETGADVLSSAELNQLQSEGKQLKERYEHVQGKETSNYWLRHDFNFSAKGQCIHWIIQ